MLHRTMSGPLRRNRAHAALVVLAALVLQAASAAVPTDCSEMADGSGDHSPVTVAESHGHSTDIGPCCDPLAPPESDDHETGSCAVAMNCVASAALPTLSSGLVDPVAESCPPSHPCAHPDALVLPNPGPPPRA